MLSALLIGLMRLLIFYYIRKKYIANLYQGNLVLYSYTILVLVRTVLLLLPLDEVKCLRSFLRHALGHKDQLYKGKHYFID